MIELEAYATDSLILSDSDAADIQRFAGDQGHPDFPCLSRTH